MSKIVLGPDAIGMPTPAKAVFWCRVYTVLGGSLVIAVKTAPFIDAGSVLQQSVEWFFSTTITMVNLLLPLIGVEVKANTVPTQNVTAMETDKKD